MTTISAFFLQTRAPFCNFRKRAGETSSHPPSSMRLATEFTLDIRFSIIVKTNTLYFKAHPVKYKIYGRLNMHGPHNKMEKVANNLCSHEISSKFVIAIEFPLLLLYCSCLEISIAEAIRKCKWLVLLT